MDFNLPHFGLPRGLVDYLAELDRFIEAEIRPLEQADDNIRFFDHRREHARTDWDKGGLPRHEWEDLLREARVVRPDLPLALASGYVTAEIEQRALEEGVGALIHKPNDVEEFCEIVQQLVRGTCAEH